MVGENRNLEKDTYVIVMYKPTGRAFSLDRAYCLKDSDLGIINCPQGFVDRCDRWLPSLFRQLPYWVQEMVDGCSWEDFKNHFEAYWLF
jgi:hypothetical protein